MATSQALSRCSRCGRKCALQCCGRCKKMGKTTVFCSQACFSACWPYHKSDHGNASSSPVSSLAHQIETAKSYFDGDPTTFTFGDAFYHFNLLHFSDLRASEKYPNPCLLCFNPDKSERPIKSHITPGGILESFGIDWPVLSDSENPTQLASSAFPQSVRAREFTVPLFCKDCDGQRWIGKLDTAANQLLKTFGKCDFSDELASSVLFSPEDLLLLHHFGLSYALRLLLTRSQLHLERSYLRLAVSLAKMLRDAKQDGKSLFKPDLSVLLFASANRDFCRNFHEGHFTHASLPYGRCATLVCSRIGRLFFVLYSGDPLGIASTNSEGLYDVSRSAEAGTSIIMKPRAELPASLNYFARDLSYHPTPIRNQLAVLNKKHQQLMATMKEDRTCLDPDPQTPQYTLLVSPTPLLPALGNAFTAQPEIQLLNHFAVYQHQVSQEKVIFVQVSDFKSSIRTKFLFSLVWDADGDIQRRVGDLEDLGLCMEAMVEILQATQARRLILSASRSTWLSRNNQSVVLMSNGYEYEPIEWINERIRYRTEVVSSRAPSSATAPSKGGMKKRRN